MILLSIALLGCATEPPRVPLVYEYPNATRQMAKSIENAITVEDQRTDKDLDKYLISSVPDSIKNVLSRELSAIVPIEGSTPGSTVGNPLPPVQIHVKLQETTVEVANRGSKKAAVFFVGVGAGDADVVGEIKMAVHVHNVQSGADWEETWEGASTTRIPAVYMDSSQMFAKALGGAVKDAMSHLPGALSRVGIEF
jgi:hypothetical protein